MISYVHSTETRSETKQRIMNAFLTLLQNEDYSLITIKQIMLEAKLARRTFYINFDSKEDILNEYLIILASRLKKSRLESHCENLREHAIRIFRFLKDNKDLLEIILSMKNGMNYHHITMEFFGDFFSIASIQNILHIRVNNEAEARYVNSFQTTGIIGIFENWILNGCVETPEELADIYIKTMVH